MHGAKRPFSWFFFVSYRFVCFTTHSVLYRPPCNAWFKEALFMYFFLYRLSKSDLLPYISLVLQGGFSKLGPQSLWMPTLDLVPCQGFHHSWALGICHEHVPYSIHTTGAIHYLYRYSESLKYVMNRHYNVSELPESIWNHSHGLWHTYQACPRPHKSNSWPNSGPSVTKNTSQLCMFKFWPVPDLPRGSGMDHYTQGLSRT